MHSLIWAMADDYSPIKQVNNLPPRSAPTSSSTVSVAKIPNYLRNLTHSFTKHDFTNPEALRRRSLSYAEDGLTWRRERRRVNSLSREDTGCPCIQYAAVDHGFREADSLQHSYCVMERMKKTHCFYQMNERLRTSCMVHICSYLQCHESSHMRRTPSMIARCVTCPPTPRCIMLPRHWRWESRQNLLTLSYISHSNSN